jgi:outer membrane protein
VLFLIIGDTLQEVYKVTESSNNPKKNVVIIIAVVIVIALIAAGIMVLRKNEGAPGKTQIGTIKTEMIFAGSDLFQYSFTNRGLDTPEYKELSQNIEKTVEKYEKDFLKAVENLNPTSNQDAQKINKIGMEYRGKMEKEINQMIVPLKKKTETAIAVVAVEKGMNTVFDKGIIVYGTEDITDRVIEKMKDENLEMPDEKVLAKLSAESRIGYFNKSVIISLPDFQKANLQIEQAKIDMVREFDEQLKNRQMSEEEQLRLMMAFDEQIMTYSNNLYAPLYRQVNRIVRKVAEENKVDIVVNMENIMYGGRNITDPIVENIMKGESGDREEK